MFGVLKSTMAHLDVLMQSSLNSIKSLIH